MRVKMLSGNQTGQIVDMARHEAEANEQGGLGEILPDVAPAPKHLGGGTYELPDGTRVRGKAKALAAMAGQG